MVRNLPAMRETWVPSLAWEDPLEKGMATHSSILAWIIPWTEEPGKLQFMGSQRVGHNWVTFSFTFHFIIKLLKFVTLWTVVHQAPLSGKSTEVDCHFLLQGIFLIQGSNLDLLHCWQILYHLNCREVHKLLKTTIKKNIWLSVSYQRIPNQNKWTFC